MSKHTHPFKFKQFEVSHHRSSMKVGVDAVILGAWADISMATTIVDAGCGCGVISLMCAQKNPEAYIMGVDIHEESIREACDNFNASPWSERLTPILIDFIKFCISFKGEIDYLISNPPYFDAGVNSPESSREIARHQGTLSPEIILIKGKDILSKNGKIGMVIPLDQSDGIKHIAEMVDMFPCREMIVRGRENKDAKRLFIEFSNMRVPEYEVKYLSIEKEIGDFTDEYRELCRDFYCKF